MNLLSMGGESHWRETLFSLYELIWEAAVKMAFCEMVSRDCQEADNQFCLIPVAGWPGNWSDIDCSSVLSFFPWTQACYLVLTLQESKYAFASDSPFLR